MTYEQNVVKEGRVRRVLALLASALALFAVLCVARHASAAPGDDEPPPRIAIITMGPGDPVFSRFGHNAILVRDARHPAGLVYNFGTFSFSSPSLITDFLQGRLRYWLSVDPFARTLSSYRAQNRSLRIQELTLPDDGARELARALKLNARPENRYYRYDYYLDNCSTRVRDALDRAVDGQIRAQGKSKARLSYREHTLRLVADDALLSLGLDLGLAGFADADVTRFDEAFLPEEFSRLLRNVTVPTPDGPKPLVASETMAFEAVRALPGEEPPSRALLHLLAGTALGGVAFALGRRSERKISRVLLGLYLALLGIAFGGVGSVLAFFWTATDHFVAHRNLNLLFCPPFALLLFPFGVLVASGNRRAPRLLERTLLACVLSAALGLLALPFAGQDSTRIACLSFPLFLLSYLGQDTRAVFSTLGLALRRLLPRPE
jgi:hypothetical protein